MNMDPEIRRVCQVTFDRYSIVKFLGSVTIDRIDGEVPKVMTDGFQRITGVQVMRAKGLGNRRRLFAPHMRYGTRSGGYESGLGFPERGDVLPGRENA
jgi:hypothetical protein